jgi:tRNA U34 5-methylaminomethyl-2-thiouridine-forming methyltransferase MnmC
VDGLDNNLSSAAAELRLVMTGDGSTTFFSNRFQEAFHSHFGAYQEAVGKFVEPTRILPKAAEKVAAEKFIAEKFTNNLISYDPINHAVNPHGDPSLPHLQILDVCYGLGYNSAAALERLWQVLPDCRIALVALELDPQIPQAALAQGCFSQFSEPVQLSLQQLATNQKVQSPRLTAQLHLGDARQTIQSVLEAGFQADAIFLDPFSPPRCPQLWTVEFLKLVSQCLGPTGHLATYSCAAAVRTALLLTGLKIGSSPPVGRRSPGTVARWQPEDLPALSAQECQHLQTQAGVPYRDPQLQDDAGAILLRRQQEQQLSQRESTASWKRRWFESIGQDEG